jgi:hypothetical protein
LLREIDSKKQTVKIVDNKIMAFVDKFVKDRQWIPSPDKYSKIDDWKSNPELHKKGIFLKGPRVTTTEAILKDKRLREWPGPNSYKPPRTEFDVAGVVKKTEKRGADRLCAFISEA